MKNEDGEMDELRVKVSLGVAVFTAVPLRLTEPLPDALVVIDQSADADGDAVPETSADALDDALVDGDAVGSDVKERAVVPVCSCVELNRVETDTFGLRVDAPDAVFDAAPVRVAEGKAVSDRGADAEAARVTVVRTVVVNAAEGDLESSVDPLADCDDGGVAEALVRGVVVNVAFAVTVDVGVADAVASRGDAVTLILNNGDPVALSSADRVTVEDSPADDDKDGVAEGEALRDAEDVTDFVAFTVPDCWLDDDWETVTLGDFVSLAVCDDDAQDVTVPVPSAAVALTLLDATGDTEVRAVPLGREEADNSDDTDAEDKPDGETLNETAGDADMDTDPRALGLTVDVLEPVDDAELHRVGKRVAVRSGEPVATPVARALEIVAGVPDVLMVDVTQLVPTAVCVCV